MLWPLGKSIKPEVRFKPEIKLWLGTLHRLGREGFHVIAIDLPGFGFSEGIQLDIRESAPFMKELLQLFKLNKVILVSPSTSIKVTLPVHFRSVIII